MNKLNKILIIKGSSQYDQFRYICDEMLNSFCTLGRIVTLLDLNNISKELLINDLFKDYDMIFSFNGIGIELYNSMKTKPLFWTFLVDHPFHHHKRLQQISDNVVVSCIDRRHMSYIDKYYPNIPWTCFVPHGGITGEALPPIPFSDRKYDIVFMGSLGNLQEINSIISLISEQFGDLVEPVIDVAMSDLNLDLETIVIDKMSELKINFDIGFFLELMNLFSSIDKLRRYYKRKYLITSLCNNNIHVDIWGNGWHQLLDKKNKDIEKRITLHDNISYNEAKYIMRDSRIILCDMPLFHDGSHERIFAAMQSFAIPITDRSIYFEETFQDNENIVFYDLNNPDSLSTIVSGLLSDKERSQRIIDNCHKVSSLHTWLERAGVILDIASEIVNL